MKIGVMADSHDRLDGVDEAFKIFADKKLDMLVHCGDFVSPFTFKYLLGKIHELDVPAKAIFGNNDAEMARMAILNLQSDNLVELSLKSVLEFDTGSRHLAVYHGQDEAVLGALIGCGTYDAVFTAHTHTVRNEIIDQTLVLNPGAVCYIQDANIIDQGSVAVYDSETNQAEIMYFDRTS